MTSTSSTHGGQPDYDLPVGSGTLQPGYSTSTLNTAYNYQVKFHIFGHLNYYVHCTIIYIY